MECIFKEYLITVQNAYWEFVWVSNAISIISSFYKVFLEILFVFVTWFIGRSTLFNFFSSKIIFLDELLILYFCNDNSSSWNQIRSVSAPRFSARLSVFFIFYFILLLYWLIGTCWVWINFILQENIKIKKFVLLSSAELLAFPTIVKCHRYPLVTMFLCLVCLT